MQEEAFVSERSIVEKQIRGRSKPYFQDIIYEPLKFSVSFAFEDTWDDEKIRFVARWLGNQEYYKPMYFTDNIHRWYYCIAVENSSLIHNCLKEGYITLNFRCNDAYTYTPVQETDVYDYSDNPVEGTPYVFLNTGDVKCEPIIYIEKVGNGSISITNNSNGAQTLEIDNLLDGENLIINCEREDIVTDQVGIYRFKDHNGVFLDMLRGKNNLVIKGNFKMKWKYDFKTLQG